MNDKQLAKDLAKVLKDPDGYNLGAIVPTIAAVQAGADSGRPCLTIDGEWQQYGTYRKGTLHLALLSRLADQTENDEHATQFQMLMTILFGANFPQHFATAKAAMKDAVAELGRVEILDYGPVQMDASVEGEDLNTVLQVNMAWRFL